MHRLQGGPRPRSGAHSSGGGVGSIATRSLDSMGGGGCAVPRPRMYSRSLSTTEGERFGAQLHTTPTAVRGLVDDRWMSNLLV